MATTTQAHHDLLGRRRGWTRIGFQFHVDGSNALLFTDVNRRLLELARQRQWQLVELRQTAGRSAEQLELRGALVNALPTDAIVQRLRERSIPTVRIGTWPHPDDQAVPAVMNDRVAAGRMAAEHFAQADFKHVAYLGRKPWGNHRAYFDAFSKRADELGVPVISINST